MKQNKTLEEIVTEASETATDKGFWENRDVDDRFPEAIALIHSELSEALEAHREQNYSGEDNIQEELADVCIRIFDLADKLDEKHSLDFCYELYLKMEMNKDREYKHGKEY